MLRRKAGPKLAFVLVSVLMVGAIVVYASKAPEDATYVGTSKCRICHMKEYKTWADTKHAKAWASLRPDERKKAECVKCHVTGWGEPSGFKNEDDSANLENVGCEDCHGPGSAHLKVAPGLMRNKNGDTKIDKVPQNKCVKCHNPHINQKKRAAELRGE